MKDLNMLIKDINKNIGEIEIGIFKNTPRKQAKAGFKQFAGGEARKVGKANNKLSNASLLEKLENNYGILSRALKDTSNVKSFFNSVLLNKMTKKNNSNEIKNTFKALFVQPILKGGYGSNSSKTIEKKGFNRKFIDTGQLVKNLQCKIGNTRYE